VIRTFACKDTEKLWNEEAAHGFPADIERAALRRLVAIHRATSLHDLAAPGGNRLEKLKGDRQGQYSIRINQQWRICFRWEGRDALEVEIVDYH
jgi:proteic killer suppression protein